MSTEYDLITIGAGSGGVAASRRAAAHGARVLIVEGDRVGGTCVIRGCVPKKLMMYAAGFSGALREAAGFGWTDIGGRFEMSRWADAKAREIDRLEGIYRDMLAASGVELAMGQARLTGAGGVEIAGRGYRAPRILLATGGAPSTTGIPGLDLAMTSNDVLDLREVPESVLVLGAGYIAVEFASILSGLGSRVTLAYRGALPLRGFDDDLRNRLVHALERQGVTLAGGVALTALRRTGDGFALERADGSVLTAAAALNATGRHPNTAGLGLDAVGAALDHSHAVVVDADSRTTAPGLWAIGDVTNRVNLTPVAIAEGRAFADTEFGNRPVSRRPSHGRERRIHRPPDRHGRNDRGRRGGAGSGRCLRVRFPPDEDGLRRRIGAHVHEARRRRTRRSRPGRPHARHRRAGDRAKPRRGDHLRRDQARLRPDDRRAPHRGRGVRAHARAGAAHVGAGVLILSPPSARIRRQFIRAAASGSASRRVLRRLLPEVAFTPYVFLAQVFRKPGAGPVNDLAEQHLELLGLLVA